MIFVTCTVVGMDTETTAPDDARSVSDVGVTAVTIPTAAPVLCVVAPALDEACGVCVAVHLPAGVTDTRDALIEALAAHCPNTATHSPVVIAERGTVSSWSTRVLEV